MSNRFVLLPLIILFFSNCSKENSENKDALFSKLDASQTGINFLNEVKNGADMNIFKYRNFYNGGGVAIGAFAGGVTFVVDSIGLSFVHGVDCCGR